MPPNTLTQNEWKKHVNSCKLKDNGLLKALAEYEKLGDDDHDDILEEAAGISQLAAALKKVKEVAANPAVLKYLTDVVTAAEADKKAAAADAAKAAAEAKKKGLMEEKDKGKDDEEDEDEGEDKDVEDYATGIKVALAKLKSSKDLSLEFVVCEAKPFWGIAIAKKIGAKQKAQLTEMTGGKRFLQPGNCRFADEHFVFDMEDKVTGLARKLQDSLKNTLGKKLPVTVGAESAGDEEDEAGGVSAGGDVENMTRPDAGDAGGDAGTRTDKGAGTGEAGAGAAGAGGAAAAETGAGAAAGKPSAGSAAPPSKGFSITASVGQGGKNKPEDVTAVQNALNDKAKAGLKVDGKIGSKTIEAIKAFQTTLGMRKPDGLVEVGRGTSRGLAGQIKPGPAPAPPQPAAPPKLGKASLAKAPEVWHSTRALIQRNIEELKKAVLQHYAAEHPDLVKEINDNLKKLDAILNELDTELADALTKAINAPNDAARTAALKDARKELADAIKYVKTEELIAHIDNNPFDVDTNLKKILTDALTHMAQAIG